jgi:Flp pilus assembly protein TadG
MKTTIRSTLSSLARTKRRLSRDTSGLAMLEFAFSAPIVLMIGLYGIETANQALINLKVSQIALNLADNASRVGLISNANIEQLREVDLNDVLQAARNQGTSIDLTTRGRITISSLENVQRTFDAAPKQRLHWQRCIGMKSGVNYDSSYGTTTTTAGTDATSGNAGTLAPLGMGDAPDLVQAPTNGGVIFVEVNYDYKPIVGQWLFGPARIHYIASFIVRDNRDFVQIYNPTPTATRSTCNLYTT